jgi:putative ABC transport system permease protein
MQSITSTATRACSCCERTEIAGFTLPRSARQLLYNVSPRDPVVIGVVTLLLTAIVLVACWLPARRASRLSRLEALRTD